MTKEHRIRHGNKTTGPVILTGTGCSGRTTKNAALGVLALMIVLPSPASRGDEVDDLVNALKPSPVDYAVWAEGLVKAAEDLKSKPSVLLRLYDTAYEHGIKRSKGYPAAIKAARAMLRVQPDRKLAWQQKLLAALKLDWQRAERGRKKQIGWAYVEELVNVADERRDPPQAARMYAEAANLAKYYAPNRRAEIAHELKDARQQHELLKRLGRLHALTADPKNLSARESLIRLLVVEFDRPILAKKLLTPDVSEELRTYVPLAVKGGNETGKEACAELADWYMSLGAKATLRGNVRDVRPSAGVRSRRTYLRRMLGTGTHKSPGQLA